MRVRKTLIFPLEQQSPKSFSGHSLLLPYRATNWLDSAMRYLQATKASEAEPDDTRLIPIPLVPPVRFRRSLMKSRRFMAARERLPMCTHRQRPGPHHW